jgi:hypothetical protein
MIKGSKFCNYFCTMEDIGKGLTASKAREILHHGEVHGHALTPRQRRYFGWVSGGSRERKGVRSQFMFDHEQFSRWDKYDQQFKIGDPDCYWEQPSIECSPALKPHTRDWLKQYAPSLVYFEFVDGAWRERDEINLKALRWLAHEK